ncbi:MAG: family 16 glycosylhydrolase [Anaerolineae bacterium]|nr:family 16 glycosylhydrolase [Anaerolineae bacterium]NIN95097.1 family 16 glycosylhydrolase [Anaerolineae bacterium]NIQ78949.1 family 16 glycosylhydrolase [Anaerolineae bacterium]
MAAAERAIYDNFAALPGDPWKRHLVGSGALEATGSTLLFINNRTSARRYTNAQIDDYQGLSRREFLWRPPLKMTVRARFSHDVGDLSGTAGFGFWNDPFMMTGRRLPTLPRVVWFFYASPPSDMKLDLDAAGHGWKAATLDAKRLPFLLLAPTAPLAVPLMNIRSVYHSLWPIGQRAMGVNEAALVVPMTEWHTYDIVWGTKKVRFSVDGDVCLESRSSPKGPLGFVMWLDNQYAVVKPWGRIGYGLLDAPGRQWMEVDALSVEPG